MKQAHIYIYGIIDFWQDDKAQEFGYVNLKSVKNQVQKQGEFEELIVHIHSDGGDVEEGFAIHDYLRSLGKSITTKVEGNCYSIATVIALAGDKRVITSNANFLIHNPWGWTAGEREEVQKYADELGKLEEKIADFYASKTNLSKEEALALMKVETSFNADEALARGFATEIATTMRAVAFYNHKNKSIKNIDMSKEVLTKNEAEKKFSLLEKGLEKIQNLLSGKNKTSALVLQDANGVEIDFTDLEDTATPEVGDVATIDGKEASGEFVMPDGRTFVFEAGKLTEIKEEVAQMNEENEQLKEQVSNLEAQNKKLKKDLESAKNEIKNFVSELADLKKDVSSSFDYNPEILNKKEKNGGEKTRNLFKK